MEKKILQGSSDIYIKLNKWISDNQLADYLTNLTPEHVSTQYSFFQEFNKVRNVSHDDVLFRFAAWLKTPMVYSSGNPLTLDELRNPDPLTRKMLEHNVRVCKSYLAKRIEKAKQPQATLMADQKQTTSVSSHARNGDSKQLAPTDGSQVQGWLNQIRKEFEKWYNENNDKPHIARLYSAENVENYMQVLNESSIRPAEMTNEHFLRAMVGVKNRCRQRVQTPATPATPANAKAPADAKADAPAKTAAATATTATTTATPATTTPTTTPSSRRSSVGSRSSQDDSSNEEKHSGNTVNTTPATPSSRRSSVGSRSSQDDSSNNENHSGNAGNTVNTVNTVNTTPATPSSRRSSVSLEGSNSSTSFLDKAKAFFICSAAFVGGGSFVATFALGGVAATTPGLSFGAVATSLGVATTLPWLPWVLAGVAGAAVLALVGYGIYRLVKHVYDASPAENDDSLGRGRFDVPTPQ